MKPGRQVKEVNARETYAQGADWQTDLVSRALRSERRAWMVAAASFLLALPAVAGLAYLGPLQTAYPVVIAVDKSTGNMEVAELSNERKVAELPAVLDSYWAKKYVVHRESYFYPLLQLDYDMTLAMSSDDVGMDYANLFVGDTSLDKQFSDRYQVKIEVISVVLPPAESGKAVVRYRKTVRQVKTASIESEQTFVATFSYQYLPSTKGQISQLMNNPLGYRVTAYRTDPELTPRRTENQG